MQVVYVLFEVGLYDTFATCTILHSFLTCFDKNSIRFLFCLSRPILRIKVYSYIFITVALCPLILRDGLTLISSDR